MTPPPLRSPSSRHFFQRNSESTFSIFFHCSNFVAASTVSSRNPQARGVASRRIPRAGAERDTIKFDDRRDDQHPGCGR